ncbi:hypothetical protein KKC60_02175 [Patescibacteria group bacterium]|nr:hypothetical protein [Patescibacteria group bacterium]
MTKKILKPFFVAGKSVLDMVFSLQGSELLIAARDKIYVLGVKTKRKILTIDLTKVLRKLQAQRSRLQSRKSKKSADLGEISKIVTGKIGKENVIIAGTNCGGLIIWDMFGNLLATKLLGSKKSGFWRIKNISPLKGQVLFVATSYTIFRIRIYRAKKSLRLLVKRRSYGGSCDVLHFMKKDALCYHFKSKFVGCSDKEKKCASSIGESLSVRSVWRKRHKRSQTFSKAFSLKQVSPSGGLIIAVEEDEVSSRSVAFDAADLQILHSTDKKYYNFAFTPDGKTLIASARLGDIELDVFKVGTWTKVSTFEHETGIDFNGDGDFEVTLAASKNHTAKSINNKVWLFPLPKK